MGLAGASVRPRRRADDGEQKLDAGARRVAVEAVIERPVVGRVARISSVRRLLVGDRPLVSTQYRFTRSTWTFSDCSVSKAEAGSPYSVNASSLMPTRRFDEVDFVVLVVLAVALAAASPPMISAATATRK